MLGVSSYRDYFSAGGQSRKTMKTESLCQYLYDIAETVGDEVKILPSMNAKQKDWVADCSGIVLFDHPTSLISQSKLTGFTTANLDIHARTLKHLIEFDGPKYIISDVADQIPNWLDAYASRVQKIPNIKNGEMKWPKAKDVRETILACEDITAKFHSVRRRPKAIFGDSHATMFWAPGYTCRTSFGTTLYRALSNGLKSYYQGELSEAIFCFGNIDLRYHLMRQENPEEATQKLAYEYVKQASEMAAKVKIASLLPVTGDIPGLIKTYLYKKQQYFGSAENRSELRTLFRTALLNASAGTNVTILDPPELFETEEGRLNEDCREVRGVHICPSKYAYCLSGGSSEPRPEFEWHKA